MDANLYSMVQSGGEYVSHNLLGGQFVFVIVTLLGMLLSFCAIVLVLCWSPAERGVTSPIQTEAGLWILHESERFAVLKKIFAQSTFSYDEEHARMSSTTANTEQSNSSSNQQLSSHVTNDDDCPICLDEYGMNKQLIKGMTCTHVFHQACLLEWLAQGNDECPVCRETMMTANEMRRAAIEVLGESEVYYQTSLVTEATPLTRREETVAID